MIPVAAKKFLDFPIHRIQTPSQSALFSHINSLLPAHEMVSVFHQFLTGKPKGFLTTLHYSATAPKSIIHEINNTTRVCLKTACAGLDVPLCGRQGVILGA